MTENSAIATANFVGRMKLGTVGEPYPDIGFRIDEETGEIQVKHAGVFAGYWNKPDKTAETFTADGWLMTGDVGEWVDGTHVRIVDRIKHIIITSGGKNISPSEIENSLKTSPYVKEAMVIGDGRNYLTALIGIELDTVGDWALRRGIPYTTYRDLSEKPEVIELIQGVVDATNEKFARVENIRRFALLPKELDHEDGELTATQKLKRNAMIDTFGDLVESLYRDDPRHHSRREVRPDTRQGPRPGLAVRARRARLRAHLQGHPDRQLRPGRDRPGRRLVRLAAADRLARSRVAGWATTPTSMWISSILLAALMTAVLGLDHRTARDPAR